MNWHKSLLGIFLLYFSCTSVAQQVPEIKPNYVVAFDLHGVVFKIDRSLMWQEFKKVPFQASSLLTILSPYFMYNFYKIFYTSDSVEEILLKLVTKYPELKRYLPTAMAMINAQKPIMGTVDIIDELKTRGYTLYVFSNIGKESLTYLRDYYPHIFEPFSGYVFTQPEDNWIQKPQEASYKKFLQKFNLIPEQVIFIDDKEVNLEPAQRMGFTTILFTSHEQLRKALTPYIDQLAPTKVVTSCAQPTP